jgi:formylglycine-generating enzyme required for sulfatase activity
VEVSAFYLGAHEVTQRQYREVMGKNPSYFSASGEGKDLLEGVDTASFPVEQVSWKDAAEFCKRLNAMADKNKPGGWVYRLPREAEWEYACRAGSRPYRAFHFGSSLSFRRANFDGLFPYGGAAEGRSSERTCRVGSYRPNAWGLYDMHGNVWEWCADWYAKDFYKKGPRRDPKGPPRGTRRAVRGGGWDDLGRCCRSASRGDAEPTERSWSGGFRVALVPSSRASVPE